MTKILILGGYGFTGKLLARHLLEQTRVEIVLAGRHIEKAQAYADQLNTEFNNSRVSAIFADAASRDSLQESLHNIDMMLVAAPTTQHASTVVRTALDCGVDYLDVQFGASKNAILRSLAPEIERAGLCFITEAGYHPGLPSALVRYAATQLDRLDSAVTAGYLNMGRALPYAESVNELMEAFRDYQGQVYKSGDWTKSNSYIIRKVDFGGGIGVRRCFSMFFEELRDLPQMYPALKELGFYISETHWLVDWVITPLVLLGLKLAPQRGMRPLGRFMWWGMQTFPRPPYLVMLKLEARGEKGEVPAIVEASLSHSDGYELTAIPVVACLLQYLDGSAHRPGLWMMGHLVEPVRLFEDMQRMGIEISTSLA